VEYKDSHIMPFITKELGWKYGGREHFDCNYKPFAAYIDEKKSVRALKKVGLAAQVRSNEMTRDEALKKIQADTAVLTTQEDIDYGMKRLDLSADDVKKIIETPPKTFLDYKTNYRLLEKFKGPIKLCCKLKLIPETMYEKLFNV
jgi:hypothetical protein